MATTIEKNTNSATSESKAPASAQPKAKRVLQPVAPAKLEVAEKQQVHKFTKLLDDNRMQSVFTCKENEDATDEQKFDVIFDYANCSREELLELATSSTRITLQGRIRKMKADARKLYAAKQQTVDVKSEIVAAARQQRDPLDRMVADFARATGMSEGAARSELEKLIASTKK
jgi:hypothetical protein